MKKEIVKKFFPKEVKRIEARQCPFCGERVFLDEFRDALSVREYNISGLCQKCQDKTFK